MFVGFIRLACLTGLIGLLACRTLFAQDIVKGVVTEGEAVVHNITPEEAKHQARSNARRDGIIKALGVRVESASFARNALYAGEFIQAVAYGHIVRETVLAEDWKTLETPDGSKMLIAYVKMEFDIVPEEGDIDPSFKVDVDLNTNAFTAGEELVITVRTTQPCYLTVLNITANDEVYVLFPHPLHPDNTLMPAAPIQIPTGEERRLGLHLRVYPMPGSKENTEYIKVIATKDPVALLDEVEKDNELEIMPGMPVMKFKNTDTALTELARWLCTIPRNRRTENLAQYIVVEKAK